MCSIAAICLLVARLFEHNSLLLLSQRSHSDSLTLHALLFVGGVRDPSGGLLRLLAVRFSMVLCYVHPPKNGCSCSIWGLQDRAPLMRANCFLLVDAL